MGKIFLTFVLLSFFFSVQNFAQVISAEKLYEFKGVIKDEDSAVFAGTNLLFSGNNKEFVVMSNSDGEFAARLSHGTYKITINKDISDSFIAFIKIGENTINPNNVEFIVKTNSICCGQSADKMYPKLLSSPKPGYPAAARAVRVRGEVVVAVKIDMEGRVIAAKAESGHPLLRTVSEKAASGSRFESSETINEREAKLTYVFINNDGKQNLKRYSNPYRTEVTDAFDIIVNRTGY
jgi:hypothetical protein